MPLTTDDRAFISQLLEGKLSEINTHLEFTDGRVDRLELSINGDPNNLKDHPGMAYQVKALCESGFDDLVKRVVAVETDTAPLRKARIAGAKIGWQATLYLIPVAFGYGLKELVMFWKKH